jgi:menaquinone-specific isochorismate synthase
MIRFDRAGALLQATENTLFYATFAEGASDGVLYFNDFWLDLPRSLPAHIEELSIASLQDHFSPQEPISLDWEGPNFDMFRRDFEIIHNKIEHHSWLKAVPIVFEKSKYSEPLFAHCLAHLVKATSGHMYAYWDDKNWFLGVSPEILYAWNGKIIDSVAVAGTAFAAKNINLLENKKEMLEHKYVIDGITEILEKFGTPEIATTVAYNVGSLTHLKTEIKVPNTSLHMQPTLIEAIHPTPAVGTYPLQFRRNELKKALSPRPPLVFAAPFGLLTPKWHKVIVAIRNLQCLNGDLYVTAGCGVVKDSVLEQEWQELKAKRQAIKQRLGLL